MPTARRVPRESLETLALKESEVLLVYRARTVRTVYRVPKAEQATLALKEPEVPTDSRDATVQTGSRVLREGTG